MPQKSEFKKQPKIVKFMLVKIYVIKPKRKKKRMTLLARYFMKKYFLKPSFPTLYSSLFL